MAWIEKRRRGDGGVSARVIWRLCGTRDGAKQVETFSAGTDAQNLARADGFKKMVGVAGVDLRDLQIAARHADPRRTMRYDRARKNLPLFNLVGRV